ncbi:MAG: TetR/AcrR family transcriptional regulator [Haloferacaceae archaeon]
MTDASPADLPDGLAADPESADVHDAIRAATFRALCEHGYSDTTIQHIADEFEKSKSLLYYHYEDKDELLAEFMRHLLDCLVEELAVDEDDPYAEFRTLVDRLVPVPMDGADRRFRRVLLEIRTQAPYDETYRDQFRRSDELVRGAFADVIARGIEAGRFRETDPERAAEFVQTALLGTMERGVTLDDPEVVARTRRTLLEYVERYLLVEGADDPSRGG